VQYYRSFLTDIKLELHTKHKVVILLTHDNDIELWQVVTVIVVYVCIVQCSCVSTSMQVSLIF